MLRTTLFASVAALAVALAPAAEAKEVKIKLGTLAPEGSPWFNILKRMGQRIEEATNREVKLTIFAGGVAGDEGDMVRKMRIGQLHAATITSIGLAKISREPLALQTPMMIESYDELDYVRDKIGPKMAADMEKEGFVVLTWGDAGWVHFFGKVEGAMMPDDFKKQKLFVWSGDPEAERAWKSAKFNTVPLSATDVLAGLKTGLVEAYSTAPIYALAANWYEPAKNMLKLNWTPLNGATVVTKKQWEQISPEHRAKILQIAAEEGAALRAEVRQRGDESIKAMVARGLKVTEPTAQAIEAWKKTAEMAYPEIRGKVVPEAYFDEVQRLTKEYRAQKKK
ncbi:TRAP transporter substrate-binding protein DctP [Myxococcota bacterium]|nr:TRAP transporter substrate-binding protein DctP [Myxococcota bacterium]